MTTPNDSDAERELQRVEEIERNKMQDRTKAIVEAAERLAKAIDVEALNGDEPPPLVVAARLDLDRALALPAARGEVCLKCIEVFKREAERKAEENK